MSWLDDLTVRLGNMSSDLKTQDSALKEALGNDIYSFLSRQTKDAGVRLVAQLGNLSEEEIRQGLTGATPAMASSQSTLEQLQNSLQASGLSIQAQKILGPALLILLGLGVYMMFFKKSGRKRR